MILVCLAAISVHQTPPTTVELFRGAYLPGRFPPYLGVEDTTLDSTEADLDQGYAHELYGADGRNIIIQFRDLNRALGPHKKILSASLAFALSGPDDGNFLSASEVLLPWHEGPNKTIMQLAPVQPNDTGARWAASWRHRRLDMPNGEWEKPGAMGPRDSSVIPQAKFSRPDKDHIRIDGLAAIVERQYEKPWTNHGFMLRFDKSIELLSSEATTDRPKLILQIEDEPLPTGPDLCVTYIERTPEYNRYENAAGVTYEKQDGVAIPVLDHPFDALSKKWPSDGDDLTYTAHIRNVGNAPASGFSAQWIVNESPGGSSEFNQTLAPGEEGVISIHVPYKNMQSDHRLQPVSVVIDPKGPDANPANNGLEIQQSALNLGIWVEKSFYQNHPSFAGPLEDWMQQQVQAMNDSIFPFSRFSFATDGVTERLRIQRITVVPDGTLQGPDYLPNGKASLVYDGEVGFPAHPKADEIADTGVLRRIGVAIGLIDFNGRNAPAIKIPDCKIKFADLLPGLMGEADTRDESSLPGSFSVPYHPYHDQVSEDAKLTPSVLLSATDVGQIMSGLGKRGGFRGDGFYDTPDVTLLAIVDYSGKRLPKADLTFYQMVNGEFPADAPAFKVQTDAKGLAKLFTRPVGSEKEIKLQTGHVLQPNPFGRIDFSGSNRAFLVKAQVHGTTAWSSFKLWHLVDAYHRGQKSVAEITLAFDIPDRAD